MFQIPLGETYTHCNKTSYYWLLYYSHVLDSNFTSHVFPIKECSYFQNIFYQQVIFNSDAGMCVYIFWWRETHGERWKESVCVWERDRVVKKHPLIHSITQFPWWFELYLTMWRTISASTFAVSLLHLFQRSELKLWMVHINEKRDKMAFRPVSGPGESLEKTSGWMSTGWTVMVVNG